MTDYNRSAPKTIAVLFFGEFSNANARRSAMAFEHEVGPDCVWSNDQWMTAIVGELGEAASALKAINRRQLAKDMDVDVIDVALELADAVTYIDLLCTQLGFDLGDVIAWKFNEVSRRVESHERLPVSRDFMEWMAAREMVGATLSGFDSTGRHIEIGSKVRWRGQEYTITGFTRETAAAPLRLTFERAPHLDEVPTETSVDRIDE